MSTPQVEASIPGRLAWGPGGRGGGARTRVCISGKSVATAQGFGPRHARHRVTAVVLGGAGIGALAAITADAGLDASFIASTAVLSALCAAPLAGAVQHWRVRLDHPATLLAVVMSLYWLLGGLVMRQHQEIFRVPAASEWLPLANLVGAAALLAFYTVVGLPIEPEPVRDPRVRLSRRARITLYGGVAFTCCVWLYEAAKGTFFTHGDFTLDTGDPWLALARQTALGSWVAAPFLFAVLRSERRSCAWAGCLIAVEASLALLSGRRLLVLQLFMVLGVAFTLVGRPPRLRTALLLAILFLFVVNPLVMGLRRTAADTTMPLTPTNIALRLLPSAIGEFPDLFREGLWTAETRWRVSASGYLAEYIYVYANGTRAFLGGDTYREALVLLVPRILWRDKPLEPGGDVVRSANLHFGFLDEDGLGNPIMEGYVNFGLPGVVGVWLVLGVVWRALWRYRQRHDDVGVPLLAYTMCSLVLLTFESHSTIGGMIGGLRLPVLVMLMYHGLWGKIGHSVRRTRRRVRHDGGPESLAIGAGQGLKNGGRGLRSRYDC